MLLHRYLIGKGTASVRKPFSKFQLDEIRNCIDNVQWLMRSVWENVKPHVVGYQWEYSPDHNKWYRYVLLDDEIALMTLEMMWPSADFRDFPYEVTFESDHVGALPPMELKSFLENF